MRSVRMVLSVAAIGMAASVAQAVPINYVHTTSMPAELSGVDKTTTPFMYLELEPPSALSGPVTPTADVGHTIGRSLVSPNDEYWVTYGAPFNANGDTAQYADRGDGTSYSDIKIYWTDVTTGFVTGQQFAVYLFTSTTDMGSGSRQTFNFMVGNDNASVDTANSIGSAVEVWGLVDPAWYKLGTFTQTAGLDTFKLRIDTYLTATQGDTILIAAVPEPGTIGILAIAGGIPGLLRRRRHS